MRYFLSLLIPVTAYWVVSLEWLLFPFFFGEHQVVMLGVGFIFALVGVFVILLLIVTIKKMS
jgi:hypothetical protein